MANGFVPELLCPAGSLDKLKTTVLYGADAVYLASQNYGLRAAADNFTPEQLREGISFAHDHGAKAYLVLNSFLHDEDLENIQGDMEFFQRLGADAFIISDLGVMKLAQKCTDVPIHLSTQASCLNVNAAKFWKKMGADRVILGREVSLLEAHQIKTAAEIEVEMFIHGSMCMAYSGNCVISNYTQGRDSNRGGCAHSCRFEYTLSDGEKEVTNFFMSSKDLEGLNAIPEFSKFGIDSVKIEGRMKGALYAAGVTKVYRKALDLYAREGELLDALQLKKDLQKLVHRSYFSGNLHQPAGADSIYDERVHNESEYHVVGTILETTEDFHVLETRSKILPGSTLEILPFRGTTIVHQVESLTDVVGENLEHTKPNQLIRIPPFEGVEKYNVVRARVTK